MPKFYQKPPFQWLLLGLMLVMNITLLILLWRSPSHPPHPQGRRGPIPVDKILKFDPQQQTAFDQLKTQHFDKTGALRAQIKQHRETAFSQLRGGHPDTALVRTHLQSIGFLTQAIETEIFDHFQQVRRMCKPEQLPVFDHELIDALLQQHQPGPGGGPPGHHRR